jgi:histidinol phosphatase-like PHP family hydrolase
MKALDPCLSLFRQTRRLTADDQCNLMRLWIDREVPPIADAQRFMDMLVERTVRIVSEEPIDIYVNPTFLPNQISSRYDELWTPERMTRVISALRANGVALEINSQAYRLDINDIHARLARSGDS